jgi:hypothetical protein
MNPSDSENYQLKHDDAKKLVKATMRLSELYAKLTGEDDSYEKIVNKKVKKLGDRNRSKKAAASQITPQQDTADAATKQKYNDIISNVSGNIANVNNIVKNIDFANASEDAVDHFSTKEDMVRRIGNQLNKAIEIGNTINSNGSIDWINTTINKLKDVADILDSIVNETDAEVITDYLVDLDGACRAVAKAAKGFAPGQTYKETGAITA